MTAMQRRPGGDSETAAVVSLAASTGTSLPLALVEYTVRLALDADSRLFLDDMPPRSNLVIDVTACRFPDITAVCEIANAARRGVHVEIVAGSVAGARAWHDAMSRAGVQS